MIRSCQCQLHTDENDVIVNRLWHHTHGSDAAGVEVAKIEAYTKRRTLDTMELPLQIHNQAIRFTGQSVQGQMPSISATKTLIQRARAQNEAPLPTPTDLAFLVVPDQYKFYHPSPDVYGLFLLGDSGQTDPSRVTIFGRDNAIYTMSTDRMQAFELASLKFPFAFILAIVAI